MKPTVIIDNIPYRKIMHWVNKSSHEVSGLGLVRLEEGVLRVTHVMLLPQVNSGTSTDIEPQDAAKMLYKCRAMEGDLRFWWHSHVDMPVFWSGTDIDTIKKIGEGGWFLSTVFNKKREMRSAFYSVNGTKTPWGTYSLFQDELVTQVETFAEPLAAQWDAEYAENVKANDYSHFQPYSWQRGYGYSPGGVSGDGRALPGEGGLLDKRPPGMPKKEWKRFRKSQKETLPVVLPISAEVKVEDLDAYGFTQDERTFLAQSGWDQDDIDSLVEEDVTPTEILSLAVCDVTPGETLVMLAESWSIGDILAHADAKQTDDVPVADRGQAGRHDYTQ